MRRTEYWGYSNNKAAQFGVFIPLYSMNEVTMIDCFALEFVIEIINNRKSTTGMLYTLNIGRSYFSKEVCRVVSGNVEVWMLVWP
jgi:hypothetical protein